MKLHLDKGIRGLGLYDQKSKEKGLYSKNEVDFPYKGTCPQTKDDVKSILLSDRMKTLIRAGKYDLPCAMVYKWM